MVEWNEAGDNRDLFRLFVGCQSLLFFFSGLRELSSLRIACSPNLH